MHRNIARRALFIQSLALGAGSLLSACTGSSTPASNKQMTTSPSALPAYIDLSPQADSEATVTAQGPVILPPQYYATPEKPYEGATLEHGPRHIAKPNKPEKMGELSETGILQFLQYWCATRNYMMLTGDTALFEAIPGNRKYSTDSGIYFKLYSQEEGWVVCSHERPVGITLNTGRPARIGNSQAYRWESTFTVDKDASLYLHKAQRNVPLTEMYGQTRRADVFVKYTDKSWQMMDDSEVTELKKELTSSPSTATPAN